MKRYYDEDSVWRAVEEVRKNLEKDIASVIDKALFVGFIVGTGFGILLLYFISSS